jgi:two-component system CheB/CheR fusion protein
MENALSHGALSEPNGTLAIQWRGDEGRATLGWQEQTDKALNAPARPGFGLGTIEGVITRQLGGSVTLDWTKHGLRADLAFNTEA